MPGQPVVLDTLGGLVATARPEDLPEGASPRNNDVDFLTGRFIQRPGRKSVYTTVLNGFGPQGAATATDVDTESRPWASPNNILLNDGSFTTVSLLGEIGVATVSIAQGGYYALSETPVAVFSGTGGGASATVVTATHGSYKVVTGVTGIVPGAYTSAITISFTGAATSGNNATATLTTVPVGQTSDTLQLLDFQFSVPANYLIKGFLLEVKGLSPNAHVYARMIKGGTAVGTAENVALPTSNGFVSMGSQTNLWGSTWTYTDVVASNFGFEVWANSSAAVSVSLDYARITVYGTPTAGSYLGIVTANLDQTDQTTIALDSNGLSWIEDVINDANDIALSSIIPLATPGSYLKGLDAHGVAYMAYSDLTQGISQPMQYNGQWCDRITQVGPGQAPVFTPQESTSNTFNIVNITQPAANSDITNPGHISVLLQSAGPSSTSPGNVLTVYYSPSYYAGAPQPGAEDAVLKAAFDAGYTVYVYISGTGFGVGTYQVTSIGNALPPGVDHFRFYFTVQLTTSTYQRVIGGVGQYQMSVATMTATAPVPGLAVGNQITIAGNSVTAYNSTWTVTEALDSGSMAVTSTSVLAGVATINYALITGVAPAAGELVTITNTTNANGDLNVTNATIATATGGSTGSFTLLVPTITDYASTPESGQATTAGTIFTFDPGFLTLATPLVSPIYGTGTGGTFIFVGAASQLITAGVKQGSVFFIDRNGAVTRPAPPAKFTVPSNCSAILVTQIPVGPANVVARGFTFTESGQNGVAGASFYFYDTAQTYVVNGTTYTSDALIVPDNTSTSATFTFIDAVLLASDEIDVPGNDYFNLMELGNPAWMFQYASRMLYGLCQAKLQNFLNLSFDGGYLPTLSTVLPMPTGWSVNGTGNVGSYPVTAFQITSNVVTVTCVNSLFAGLSVVLTDLLTGTYLNNVPLVVLTANGTSFTAAFSHADVGHTVDTGTVLVTSSSIGLVTSLDFGNAFRMRNLGAASWTSAAVLFQGAAKDYLNVPIIRPNIGYSIRVKARALTADAQKVTVKLLPYSNNVFGTAVGSVALSFDQGNYVIQTAELLTAQIVIPTTLVIALGVSEIAVAAGVEVDRIEIFPTDNPIDTTTIWTSYANNFEAVDIVTGSLGVGAENPQPAQGAYEILEQLYIEKTQSLQVTQDSPNYEPNNWQVRQASDRAGALGPNAFDEGEEFAVMASRNGLYFFDGGKPMPISRELQSSGGLNLWETINWNAGKSIWIRNDLNQRRLMVGLPMITPNFWLPNAPSLVPTTPNVILMCNYTGCPTGEELASSAEVHVTMFGDLKALDQRRKWSIWQIPCPVAEFVPREDAISDPLFLCNGNISGKIYQLLPGAAVAGQNTDDGDAINWSYTTSSFVKAKAGQQIPGLGALRKIWYYLAATMEGVGKVACKLYSNSLGALPRNTFTVPLQFTLSYPQQNDQERVLEIGGQRVFIEFSSVGTGGYTELGPVMLDGEMDKVSPHRGVAS